MARVSDSGTIPLLIEKQEALSQEPYSIPLRLSLADQYEKLEYPDLAAGESYRTILLIDEVIDSSGEYHDEALAAATREYKQYVRVKLSCKDSINDNRKSNKPEGDHPDIEVVSSNVRETYLPTASVLCPQRSRSCLTIQ